MSCLAIAGFASASVSIDPIARSDRDAYLDDARAITKIDTDQDFAAAGEMVVTLKRWVKSAEDTRKEVKAPVVDLGRRIDHLTAELVTPLEIEQNRLSQLRGKYMAAKEEAERKRQQELQRIERERIAAEEKAKREADEAILKAKSIEAAELAIAQENERKKQAAEAAVAEAKQVAPVFSLPRKVKGVNMVPVWMFEVLDINLLHKHNPDLVLLTPKQSVINSAIAAGHHEIPGLRIWQEHKDRGTR